jgi:carbamoyl-phosphate synthase large subunit
MGTSLKNIKIAEDRQLFKNLLQNIGEPTMSSYTVYSVDEAMKLADKLKYPLMTRVGFALGGAGSGKISNKDELRDKMEKAFAVSTEALLEEWLGGWKEIEYEVTRDSHGNCITICNMENMDPVGIHTGESIVVAPSQTLDDYQYQKLRSVSIKIANALNVIGECNVQFAVRPDKFEYRIIEVNPRLSRSSALASKATGYPIAAIATMLALGGNLTDIPNDITGGRTKACTEPAMDYCVVKIPVWNFAKFDGADRTIGSEMRSVGEVMAIDRNFECALQKAVRMKSEKFDPFNSNFCGSDPYAPSDKRLLSLFYCLYHGESVDKLYKKTGIDPWFLNKLKNIADFDRVDDQQKDYEEGKKLGFSDERLEHCGYHRARTPDPCTKIIDTLAGEYDAVTNYSYKT